MLRVPICRETIFHHGQADDGRPRPSRAARRALRVVSDLAKLGLLCDLHSARDHRLCQSLERYLTPGPGSAAGPGRSRLRRWSRPRCRCVSPAAPRAVLARTPPAGSIRWRVHRARPRSQLRSQAADSVSPRSPMASRESVSPRASSRFPAMSQSSFSPTLDPVSRAFPYCWTPGGPEGCCLVVPLGFA